jgi:hypothetical protein
MSFQHTPTKTPTVRDDIATLKADINRFASMNVHDIATQRTFARQTNDLRRRANVIQVKISTDPNSAQARREFTEMKANLERAIAQVQTGIDDAQKPMTEKGQAGEMTPEQLQLQKERENAETLEFLDEQTSVVLAEMKAMREITDIVANVVAQSHTKVVSIDQKIENAKGKMIKGNEALEQAEKDQKASCAVY